MKKVISLLLCGVIVLSCGMSNLGKGSLIGSGAGAVLGAGIGYLIGQNGEGAAIGAAVGTAVGAGTGALIGNAMDKKAKELAGMFIKNFKKFENNEAGKALVAAGPQL